MSTHDAHVDQTMKLMRALESKIPVSSRNHSSTTALLPQRSSLELDRAWGLGSNRFSHLYYDPGIAWDDLTLMFLLDISVSWDEDLTNPRKISICFMKLYHPWISHIIIT